MSPRFGVWDLGLGVQSDQSPNVLRVYTEALVVPLPIPDFSMPYNVITITCTALVMLIGSLLNVLRKRTGEMKRQGTGEGWGRRIQKWKLDLFI